MQDSDTPTTTSSGFDDAVLPAPAVRSFPIVGGDPGSRYVQLLIRILYSILYVLMGELMPVSNNVVGRRNADHFMTFIHSLLSLTQLWSHVDDCSGSKWRF